MGLRVAYINGQCKDWQWFVGSWACPDRTLKRKEAAGHWCKVGVDYKYKEGYNLE